MGVLRQIKTLDDAFGHFLLQITYRWSAERSVPRPP